MRRPAFPANIGRKPQAEAAAAEARLNAQVMLTGMTRLASPRILLFLLAVLLLGFGLSCEVDHGVFSLGPQLDAENLNGILCGGGQAFQGIGHAGAR